MMSCTPLRPRSTRWRRNADQPDLSSLAPSQMPENLSKTFGIDGWSRLSEQFSASISDSSLWLGCHADGEGGEISLIGRAPGGPTVCAGSSLNCHPVDNALGPRGNRWKMPRRL